MSEAWRNSYDSWKLATPPWLEGDDEDEDAREDAEAAAFARAESAMKEERCP